jgi:hypothetical protein
MAMFIVNEATGLGTGDIDSAGAFADLAIIANEAGLGLDTEVDGQQQVTYARTLGGPPQLRLDELVNTDFQPDYGAGPQDVDILIVSLPDDFIFGDGSSLDNIDNGVTLPPLGSGLSGDFLNPTVNCLILYDTQLEICVVRDGTGGTIDLQAHGPTVLFHELSHARRTVLNQLLDTSDTCDPASPEENAAIIDENDMRRQIADLLSVPAELRDPGNACADLCPSGGVGIASCCIVATLVTGSPRSQEVQRLRQVRDGFLRTTDTGHDFFATFFHDYYSFSPQVCTMIAGRPSAKDVVRSCFVEPLLDFWQFMVARSVLVDATNGELGAAFVESLPLPADRPERLSHLVRTSAAWEVQYAEGGDIPREMFTLLRERAWPSPSIQWALVDPLRIYGEVLTRACAGDGVLALGTQLRRLLDEWTPRLPLTGTWGSLNARELAQEFGLCKRALLQTPAATRAFCDRLAKRFPTVTVIRELIGNEDWEEERGR